METPYQLYISLQKDYFKPSDLITGTVHLKILNSMIIDNITLTLTKEMKIDKPITVYTHIFNLFRPEEPFKICAGHHIYPFSFFLNANDNASINSIINVGELLHIENNYILSVDVKIYGVYMPIINSKKYIDVIDNNDYESKIVKKIMFNSCFCLMKKYARFTSCLDKTSYLSGEEIPLHLDCEATIKSVGVYLYQLVTLQNTTFKTNYTLLFQDERVVNDNIAKIRIPIDFACPSTASESFFDVKYVLQVVVRFRRRANIQYKHDVFVIKQLPNVEKEVYLDCLSGMESNMQFFSLE